MRVHGLIRFNPNPLNSLAEKLKVHSCAGTNFQDRSRNFLEQSYFLFMMKRVVKLILPKRDVGEQVLA